MNALQKIYEIELDALHLSPIEEAVDRVLQRHKCEQKPGDGSTEPRKASQ